MTAQIMICYDINRYIYKCAREGIIYKSMQPKLSLTFNKIVFEKAESKSCVKHLDNKNVCMDDNNRKHFITILIYIKARLQTQEKQEKKDKEHV